MRLIRIHTLADAGVPLARVQELLDAGAEAFADGVRQIDKELRDEIRRLQANPPATSPELAAGDHLALPPSVVGYLDRLRELGVDERYIELESDAWIMIAAQVPDQIDVGHRRQARRAATTPTRSGSTASSAKRLDWSVDDPRIVEVADFLERLMIRAVEAGRDRATTASTTSSSTCSTRPRSSPPRVARRLRSILEERGWKGWIRIERVPANIARS